MLKRVMVVKNLFVSKLRVFLYFQLLQRLTSSLENLSSFGVVLEFVGSEIGLR